MWKLRRNAGETLAEMLVSVLIISLGMLMLSGAIIAAARVNSRARRMAGMTADAPSVTQPLPFMDYDGVIMLRDEENGGLPVKLIDIKGVIRRRPDGTLEIYDYERK